MVPISAARVRLFELVDDLLTGRAHRVALSHRGHGEHVVLLRASELAKLEADLATLRERAEPEPRPLRGLGRLHAPVDDVVAAVRARQRGLADAKRAALVGDGPPPPARRAAPRA